jgi:hypothetical protein
MVHTGAEQYMVVAAVVDMQGMVHRKFLDSYTGGKYLGSPDLIDHSSCQNQRL